MRSNGHNLSYIEHTMKLTPLYLKRNEDKRIRAGHCWIFSNEIDVGRSPLSGFETGQAIELFDYRNHALGTGYINPNSLICARLVSRDARYTLDRSLLVHRINIALSLRERLFEKPFYRLIYGESDGLPGLVVDRFDDILVAQITTAGMEQCKDEVASALQKVIKPIAVIFRNDAGIRKLEGLEKYTDVAIGSPPDKIIIDENGILFEVDPIGGQKTGWFYDHRVNRQRTTTYIKERTVLDVFSYSGAWGVQCAARGARHVTFIDASQNALQSALANAELNHVPEKVKTCQGDAFEVLRTLRAERQKFDVVILDPPAFIKYKKDKSKGIDAYRRINQLAVQILSKDGILVSASCSYHLTRSELKSTLLKTSRHLDRQIQILEQGHQGPDHPIHPAIAETDYLKAFISRILPV